ncbi:MAG: hypothetical protein RL648_1088, partial [Verrucomicrobiota bacterium]
MPVKKSSKKSGATPSTAKAAKPASAKPASAKPAAAKNAAKPASAKNAAKPAAAKNAAKPAAAKNAAGKVVKKVASKAPSSAAATKRPAKSAKKSASKATGKKAAPTKAGSTASTNGKAGSARPVRTSAGHKRQPSRPPKTTKHTKSQAVRSSYILFTIQDAREIIQKRLKEESVTAPKKIKPVKAAKAKPEPVKVLEPPRQASRHGAASLEDILGLASTSRTAQEQKVPKKF